MKTKFNIGGLNMYSSYGELCTEVYDISKPLGHSFGDVEFYTQRLIHSKGKVLEAGCGSGRVLIPLLEAGINVDGLDNSTEMLSSCRKRCEERELNPILFEGTMQDFKVDEKYEAIIVPSGSFLLLESREDSIKALQHFYDHLKPGGKLIIDTFLQTDLNTNKIATSTWNTAKGEVITLEEKRIEVNFLEQRMVSLLKYEKWLEGDLLKTELQRFPLRWYGIEEFKLMLEKVGFKEITISADYKYNQAPTNDQQMLTYEAIK